jgi:hypothetical protein
MADVKISGLPASTTPLAGTEVLPIVQGGVTKQVSVDNLTAGKAVSAANVTVTGNLTFSSTAQRIIGDFSNATVANRLAFQTSTANTITSVGVIPNGTSPIANFRVYGSSDVANANVGQILQNGGTETQIRSDISGTATHSPMTFFTGGSEKMRIATTGDVSLVTGNLVIGTSGKGIDFSATAGTGTSELLADYEEGTFTPVVIGSTTAGTASYDFRIARYTKIGRMVQIEIAFQWNSGTGTGNLQISGLPFTNAANYSSLAIGRIDSLTLSALNIVTSYVEANADLINFRQYATGGGADSAVAYDAAALIFIAGCYSV